MKKYRMVPIERILIRVSDQLRSPGVTPQLMISFRLHGFDPQYPLIVEKYSDTDYLLLAGYMRLYAAKMFNIKMVPVVVQRRKPKRKRKR